MGEIPYLSKKENGVSANRLKLYKSKKIILAKIALRTEAFYDEVGEFASVNTNCFHDFNDDYNPKYILAWLNSKLFQFTFDCFFEGLKMQGGYLLYSAPNVSKMYIKKISLGEQKPFIALADKIINLRTQGKDTNELEKQIDDLFYKILDISPKDQKTIELSIPTIEVNENKKSRNKTFQNT
jgi:hypothetical protein